MSLLVDDETTALSVQSSRAESTRADYPPRLVPGSWAATRRTRQEVLAEGLSLSPLLESYGKRHSKGVVGLRLLLDWLADQPGQSWQERWQSSGADAAGRAWRAIPSLWLDKRGHGPWRREALIEALPVMISADLVRPSLSRSERRRARKARCAWIASSG